MDFSVIFQLRTKKFWWMDVIFYFVISLLIATVLCYLIFLTKNIFQREDIKKVIVALQTVGTDQQKEYEAEVINYKKKINDFTELFKNHEFTSNVFAFMQAQTLPSVWFNQFSLDKKNKGVQLSGESDDMDAFSRQVATFEKNEYVKSIGALNSSLGESARTKFNINLALDQNIFSYLFGLPSILETTTPPVPPPSAPPVPQSPAGTPSSEKLITSFHLLLNPEVAGLVDETNYIVTLNVPYGTDVKNLTSSIVISPGATVLPASNVSQDFVSPVTYMVTAQDGSIQSYKVTVNILPQVSKKPSQSKLGIWVSIIVIVIIAAIAAAALFFWRKRKKAKK